MAGEGFVQLYLSNSPLFPVLSVGSYPVAQYEAPEVAASRDRWWAPGGPDEVRPRKRSPCIRQGTAVKSGIRGGAVTSGQAARPDRTADSEGSRGCSTTWKCCNSLSASSMHAPNITRSQTASVPVRGQAQGILYHSHLANVMRFENGCTSC